MPFSVVERGGQDKGGHAGCMVFLALHSRAEFGRELRGAVFCLGEEVVWEVDFDLMEVISEGSKRLVVRFSEEQIEFRSVELESVYLAVLKFKGPDDGIGGEESCAGVAEPVVCAEWPVGLEPVLERSRRNLDMGSSPGYAFSILFLFLFKGLKFVRTFPQ